jgi:hypothetical protein
VRTRRLYLCHGVINARQSVFLFFHRRRRGRLLDGGHIRAFLREVDDGYRADFQTAFRASGTTVVKLIQARRMFPAFGNERSILRSDMTMRRGYGVLNHLRVVRHPGKRLRELPRITTLAIRPVARQIAVIDASAYR